jgi:hypothetical protein
MWFAGVHSDVGGGYPEIESGLSKFPLLWMINQAKAAGLQMSTSMINYLVQGKERKDSPRAYTAPNAEGRVPSLRVEQQPVLQKLRRGKFSRRRSAEHGARSPVAMPPTRSVSRKFP